MLKASRLLRLADMVLILDSTILNPHINFMLNHISVKAHMSLTGKEFVSDVQPLYRRMTAAAPDVYLGTGREETLATLHRRRRGDVVLVHLVQGQVVLVGPEETLADFGHVDPAVRQLPLLGGVGANFRAQETGEELVAEADAAEFHVGTADPEFWVVHALDSGDSCDGNLLVMTRTNLL